MKIASTVLIIPPNDAEAILISQIADKIGLHTIKSRQTHGASLDKGRDFAKEIRHKKYKTVIVVEMPGLKMEARLKKITSELIIIDHHHYTGLDRAHDAKTGKMLGSSLEQFIQLFKLSDTKLIKLGFDPFLVRGIAIMDRGYVWALFDEGYIKSEVKKVLTYHDDLIAPLKNKSTELNKQKSAHRSWERRIKWNNFFIVKSGADLQLRPRLSRIVVDEIGKPTPLIIIEKARHLIYVQESDHALHLLEKFGGFTFGLDRNWGYRNEKGKKTVSLKDVKKAIEEVL